MGRVLLIEDFAVIRRLIEIAIKPLGLDMISYGDGESGLDAIIADPPDLILLDIGLPGIDGWEIMKELRATHSMKELPILVVTAHGSYEDEVRAMGLGANGFISKPFQPDELMDAVDRLMKGAPTV